MAERLKTQRTRHAAAVVLRDQVGIVLGVYGVVVAQVYHLFERVVDEDKADEGGEALLREAREVLHQEAGVRGDQHQAEQARPQADPQPELEVVKAVVSEERREKLSIMSFPETSREEAAETSTV